MKLIWASAVHLLIAAVIGGGIVMLMTGKPALLISGVVVYTLAFAKFGCASQ